MPAFGPYNVTAPQALRIMHMVEVEMRLGQAATPAQVDQWLWQTIAAHVRNVEAQDAAAAVVPPASLGNPT